MTGENEQELNEPTEKEIYTEINIATLDNNNNNEMHPTISFSSSTPKSLLCIYAMFFSSWVVVTLIEFFYFTLFLLNPIESYYWIVSLLGYSVLFSILLLAIISYAQRYVYTLFIVSFIFIL